MNPLAAGRRSLAKEFAKHDVEVRAPALNPRGPVFVSIGTVKRAANHQRQTLFIESACDDERIIEENVRSVKISSPDVGLEAELGGATQN